MITFSRLGTYGAMGNQLFQYAALFGLSRKTGFEMRIPEPPSNVDGKLKIIGRYSNDSKNPIEKYLPEGTDIIPRKFKINISPNWNLTPNLSYVNVASPNAIVELMYVDMNIFKTKILKVLVVLEMTMVVKKRLAL